MPAILATGGTVCSMVSGFWCESIKFEALDPVLENIQRDDLHFGPWKQLEVTIETVEIGSGYEKVVTRKECVDWKFDPTIDSKWKAVRAFTIITAIVGGFLAIGLWFVPCLGGRISDTIWRGVAITFTVFLTMFQGLTFLIFSSNACDANSVTLTLQQRYNTLFYEDECSWDSGSTTNVIAVVLFFLTGITMLISGPPKSPPSKPTETQTVTYEKTTAEDGTQAVVETKVVKGKAVPIPEQGVDESNDP